MDIRKHKLNLLTLDVNATDNAYEEPVVLPAPCRIVGVLATSEVDQALAPAYLGPLGRLRLVLNGGGETVEHTAMQTAYAISPDASTPKRLRNEYKTLFPELAGAIVLQPKAKLFYRNELTDAVFADGSRDAYVLRLHIWCEEYKPEHDGRPHCY